MGSQRVGNDWVSEQNCRFGLGYCVLSLNLPHLLDGAGDVGAVSSAVLRIKCYIPVKHWAYSLTFGTGEFILLSSLILPLLPSQLLLWEVPEGKDVAGVVASDKDVGFTGREGLRTKGRWVREVWEQEEVCCIRNEVWNLIRNFQEEGAGLLCFQWHVRNLGLKCVKEIWKAIIHEK